MAVKELIDKLQQFDEDKLVLVEDTEYNVGSNYARIKAEDKIWEGLGFVLQWAKYGLKK